MGAFCVRGCFYCSHMGRSEPKKFTEGTKKVCTSRSGHEKKTWATPQAAEFVARYWMDLHPGDQRYAYHCDACSKWHVTKRAPRKMRQKKATPARPG